MSARRFWLAAALAVLALPAWAQSPKQGVVAEPLVLRPFVDLNSPADGQHFVVGQSVLLDAVGFPSNGEIVKTSVTLDGSTYAMAYAAEVTAYWTATLGTHTVYATTWDEAASRTTPVATITVSANTPPTVSLTAPANGTVYAIGAAVPMTATASDSDSTIARVEFWIDGAKVGEDTSSPYAYTWTGTVGDHAVLAKAVDSGNATTSTAAITIHGNAPPTASLTAPANGAVYLAGSAVAMSATASDSDGTVSKVEFWVDGAKVGEDPTSPYTYGWTGTAGPHSVVAKAVDNYGAVGSSGTIAITGNTPPTISLTSPAGGTSVIAGSSVALAATASDSDGSVSKVEFFIDGGLVATDTVSPYSASWTAAGVGSHSVTARATDNNGATKDTAAASITVNADPPPTVTLTAPTGGASYIVGSVVALSATASDNGTVTKVEFFIDGGLVATDTVSPYSASWTATGVGSHSVTARATDNTGATKDTVAVSITVNADPPPTVTLTAPSNGASYITGNAVTLGATASDNGTVTKVEFYVDNSLVATDTSSPYSTSWTATGVGSHTVKAKAYDNAGGSTFSSQVSITVNADPPPAVSLTAPSNGASYIVGNAVTLSATASDNGTVTKVEFYVDNSLSATDTSSPYSASWTAGTAGTHTVKAKAYDNAGGSTFSSQASITVNPPPNTPPSVSLTSPVNGASFVSGNAVTLSATASDTDGTVTQVEFFIDGVARATDTSGPFGATWTATPGSHTIKARATDDDLAGTDSTQVTITVAAAPVTIARNYFYNGYQELCRVEEPETGATLMGYDAAGNLAWSASGLPTGTACSSTGDASPIVDRRVLRTYDARNRIATLTFPDANGNQSWTYTPDGLPSSVTTYNDAGASSVVNTYAYNKRRLLTGESQASGSNTWSVGYGYTANGHLATLVYPDSLTVAYAPNALGQATQAGSYATNVTYYPNGAIAGFTYGNGIVHSLTQNVRGLPDRSRDLDGATPVHDDSYIYDRVGNVAAIADAVGPGFRGDRDMTYDALNRLTQVTGADGAPSPMFGTATYTYDDADNLVHVHVTGGSQPRNQDYFYDTTNRLTNIISDGGSDIGLGYDVQGNLANRNGTLYTFDYGNRLRSGGPETYRYDVQGRRIRSSSSAGLIYSLYSQSGQLLFQRDERAGKRRQYVYLGGSLVAESATGLAGGTATVTYQHTDALGTPVATTNSAKTVLERSEYEPYGYLLNRPMEDGPGYTGHVTDAATGLVYMQQRYYDPEIGAFPTTDPVTPFSAGGAFNRYWYANANPYRFTDPDGRQSQAGQNCGEQPCPDKPDQKPQKPEQPRGCGTTRNCYRDENGHWSSTPRNQIDWVKVAAATLRVGNSGRLGASGLMKLGIGGATSTTGVGTAPGAGVMAWGAWNLRSSLANYQAGIQLANEAQQGSRHYTAGEAARAILVGGLLPFGTLADDPGEPSYIQVVKQKFYESPHNFFLELGTLSP